MASTLALDDSRPFDTQTGTPQKTTQAQWPDLMRWNVPGGAQGGVVLGEANELAATGASDGLFVHVDTGNLYVRGFTGANTSSKRLDVAANSSGSTRIDRAVARFNFSGHQGEIAVKTGTTVPPALQQDASIWEVPLAQIVVPNGAGTIDPSSGVSGHGYVVDERWFVGGDGRNLGDLCFSARITAPDSSYIAAIAQLVSRVTYGRLYTALGAGSSPWGQGDGSTTFGVPDLRGRSPMGAGTGPSLTARTAGALVGEEAHILTIAELPFHDHGSNTAGDFPAHVHNETLGYYVGPGAEAGAARMLAAPGEGGVIVVTTSGPTGLHQHAIPAQGGGGGHNVVGPVTVVSVFIKAR